MILNINILISDFYLSGSSAWQHRRQRLVVASEAQLSLHQVFAFDWMVAAEPPDWKARALRPASPTHAVPPHSLFQQLVHCGFDSPSPIRPKGRPGPWAEAACC